jgi:hypothetical protein
VIPISVGVGGGNLNDLYSPMPSQGLPENRSGLTQIDVDFPTGGNATEWFRWDTVTNDGFVRDDIDAVNDLLQQLIELSIWDPGVLSPSEDTLKTIEDQLDFRGQDGTQSNQHQGGARVLPTQLLGGWGIQAFEAVGGLPGRNDAVTLVNTDQQKEWHRVNWATTQDDEWNGYALVGLRDAVVGEFVRTDDGDGKNYALADLGLDQAFDKDSSSRRELEHLNADSRLFTRMLCAPSGELPTGPIADFHLGADFSGRPSAGKATVDELRFHAPATPSPWLPDTGRFVLAEECKLDEDRQLRLDVQALQFPFAYKRSTLLGKDVLEVLSSLPQAGGLLLVGEEIIGYAGLDPTESGNVFLTARGLYGTRRADHQRGEIAIPLLFWPASPLAGSVSETADHLALAEAGGLPDHGLVWVDDELVGYDSRHGAELGMPSRRGNILSGDGLLRGRFGTAAAAHAPGAMVRWMPERHRDRALLGEDVPESESFPLGVSAPGAFFTDLAVRAFLPDPTVGLDVRAVLDGLASPHADPAQSRHVFALADAGGPTELSTTISGPIGRQGDRLDLWFFARWRPGAFDPRDFRSNGWKLAPEVTSVLVGHLQPTLVFEHEEW